MIHDIQGGTRSKRLFAVFTISTIAIIAFYIAVTVLGVLPSTSLWAEVFATIIGIGVIETISRVIYYYLSNSVNKAEAKTLSELFRILAYMILLFALVTLVNKNITGFLVSAGFLGIVFGLAAQSTLANFIAGIYLLASKAIEPGDNVVIHSSLFSYMPQSYPHDKFIPGFPGTVEYIGVLYTKLVNDDGVPLYMPNSAVASSIVINYHRAKEHTRRIQFDVDLSISFERIKRMIDLTMKKNKVKAYETTVDYLHNNIYVVTIYLKSYSHNTRELRSQIFSNVIESISNLKKD